MPRQVRFSPAGIDTGESQLALAASGIADQVGGIAFDVEARAQSRMLSETVADMQVKTQELQAEFEHDPVGFDAAHRAHFEGVTSKMPSFVRDRVAGAADRERRMVRLGMDEAVKAEIEQADKVALSNGLSALSAQAGGMSFAGDTEGFESSREDFNALVEIGRAQHLLTPLEADQALKSFNSNNELELIRGHAKRVPDRLKWLDGLLNNPQLGIDDRKALIDVVQEVTAQENFVADQQDKMAEAARKERFREGERVATVALMEGSLTDEMITNMTRAEQLEPGTARTLAKAKDEDMPTDILLLDSMITDPLAFDDGDIMSAALKPGDKLQVLAAKRAIINDAENWRNSNGAREGARRIKGSLGLVGAEQIFAQMDEELAKRVNRSLTEWYDAVEALPVEQRPGKARELADAIVEKIQSEKVDPRIAQANALERQLANLEPDTHEYKAIVEQVKRLRE